MGAGNEPAVAQELRPMDDTQRAEYQPRIITIGEQWRARVLATIARRTIGQGPSQFSAVRQKRYLPPRAQLLTAAGASPLQPGDNGEPVLAAQGFAVLVQPKHAVTEIGLPVWLTASSEPLRNRADANAVIPLRRSQGMRQRPSPEVAPTLGRAWQPGVGGNDAQPAVARPLSQTATDLAAVEQSQPAKLDVHAQQLLAGVLEMRIPAVKLYVNQAADTVARRYRADAVSIGDRILFRAGKFDPHSPAGLGLLGHELTHAAQARLAETQAADALTQRAGEPQELAALHNEARVLHHFAAAPAGAFVETPTPAHITPGAVGAQATGQASQPGVQVRTAAVDRPMAAENAGAAALLTAQQLQQVKDAVYRDLMVRIRTEFERGG